MDRRKNETKRKLELVIRAAMAARPTPNSSVRLRSGAVTPWHRETPQRINAMRCFATDFGYKLNSHVKPMTLSFYSKEHKVDFILHSFKTAASCAAFLLKTYNERYPIDAP
jgi:hypothetical protein